MNFKFIHIYIFTLFFSTFSQNVSSQDIFNINLSDQFIENVQNSYNEREKVDPHILNSSPEGIFTLREDSEVFTTFIDEGAGYKNTFGIFTLKSDYDYSKQELDRTSIESKQLLFNNASKVGSGGNLKTGDTISSGIMKAGTQFGFYLEANGYNRQYPHTFYSYTPFNSDGIKHSILSYDYGEDKLVLGFEDLYRGGDKDYNDLLVAIFTNPTQSLRESSSDEGVPNITGTQKLETAKGMVHLTVLPFGKIEMEEEIILYPEDLSQHSNIKFSGASEFLIESNTGVIISVQITNLTNGQMELETNYLLNGLSHSLYTPPSSTHKGYHLLELNTIVSSIGEVESDEYRGNVTLTMSIY